MLNSNLIEDAKVKFVDFLDAFKLDLISEVSKAIQKEITTAQSAVNSQDQTLTRREAAKLLNCSFTTLCHYQKEGVIPFYKVGKKVLFKREEILAAIRHQVKNVLRHEKQG